jgi:hypothetical protein
LLCVSSRSETFSVHLVEVVLAFGFRPSLGAGTVISRNLVPVWIKFRLGSQVSCPSSDSRCCHHCSLGLPLIHRCAQGGSGSFVVTALDLRLNVLPVEVIDRERCGLLIPPRAPAVLCRFPSRRYVCPARCVSCRSACQGHLFPKVVLLPSLIFVWLRQEGELQDSSVIALVSFDA